MIRMKPYKPNVMNIYANKNRMIPHKLYSEIKARRKCRDCGIKKKSNQSFQIHHIIPISQGGKSIHNNLILLCPDCHNKRHELI